MKIALIGWNPYYYPDKPVTPLLSGHSVGFNDPLIRFLLKHDHQVCLISMDPNGPRNSGFPIAPSGLLHINIKEPNLHKIALDPGDLAVQAALLKTQAQFGGLDLVLVVYVFPSITAVNLFKKQMQYKVMAFLRGSDLFSGCSRKSPFESEYGSLWPYIHELTIKGLNQSERIYCVSEMMAIEACKEGIRIDGISFTPPFEDDSLGNQDGDKRKLRKMLLEEIAISPAPDPDKHWVAYLGRLHPEKRIDRMIRAVGPLDGGETICAGIGEDEARLKSIGRASFGFVPPRFVPLFCRCVDIAVHPTTPDYFLDARPSACTNFSYHGVPIVFAYNETRPCSGLKEIVSPSNYDHLAVDASLDEEPLVEAIRNKIRLLIERPELRKEIGAQNREFSRALCAALQFKRLEEEMLKLCES
jgi:glycosyltransferase involved in cell wall biosynthesis